MSYCPICYEWQSHIAKLPCHHKYCRQCLQNTFESHVSRLGIHIPFFCPDCKVHIPPDIASPYMSHDFRMKYQQWVKDDKKEKRKKMLFCCRSNSDLPDILEEDLDKDIFLNHAYIDKRAKRCYHCKVPTQKNGGCDHMTCSRCRKEWCWICEQKFHPGFSCEQWKTEKYLQPIKRLIGIFFFLALVWSIVHVGIYIYHTSVFSFFWSFLRYPFIGIWTLVKYFLYIFWYIGKGILFLIPQVISTPIGIGLWWVFDMGCVVFDYFKHYLYYPFDAVLQFFWGCIFFLVRFAFSVIWYFFSSLFYTVLFLVNLTRNTLLGITF
eukprot:TRINITY_DN5247_c0_g1_i1.p1 TRINITY_DN5247_c0_g1~~TRINITY_DN5247_c0_g1_i1.p1  ORF type:complete len:322 (+),score=20.26 TRINITY_DN5247_c0_g1_i1:113-1078(+)